jgi:hypothetical protein
MKRLLAILTVLALAFAAPPALAYTGQQTQAERARQEAQRERERAQREAQQERERAQREAQQERERIQREREQERERVQREREQERDRRNTAAGRQTERQTRTLNIGADGEIDLSNIAGDIQISRSSGNSVTLDYVKTASGPNANEVLPLVSVDIVERGTRVEVRTRYPDRDLLRGRNLRNINVNVSFTIAAPRNARLTIKSISGDITVRDISGPLNLESTSGSVRITNVGRTVAKSISGNIEAVDTKIDGPLEAGSVSGAVRLLRTTVTGVDATSVSGDVVFEDVVSDRVNGQSISGTVTFGGELARNGRYELTSHSGTVRVALSGKTGFRLEATSFSGSINTEFALTMSGQSGRRNMRATYGDGAATLDLNAFSGSILITKR